MIKKNRYYVYNIRKQLIAENITKEDAAKIIGISVSSITGYMNIRLVNSHFYFRNKPF